MNHYTVTYVQEVTQLVKAHTIGDAGAYAKKYAANDKGMRVLSVYPVAPVALPPAA